MTKKVIIYSKVVCPYCVKAKFLLKRKNVQYDEIIVDSQEKMEEMLEKSGGRKTVPQIFIGDRHVGGCDDLYELEENGGLDEILQ